MKIYKIENRFLKTCFGLKTKEIPKIKKRKISFILRISQQQRQEIQAVLAVLFSLLLSVFVLSCRIRSDPQQNQHSRIFYKILPLCPGL